MTVKKTDKFWKEPVEGVDFDNHEESYNFYLNLPECLICGGLATHWIPSEPDGWQMPACEDHHDDLSITDEQWAKARDKREALANKLADLKCCKCGGKPVANLIPANQIQDRVTLDDNTSDSMPLCWNCWDSHVSAQEMDADGKRAKATGLGAKKGWTLIGLLIFAMFFINGIFDDVRIGRHEGIVSSMLGIAELILMIWILVEMED
ncbi:MAG: hypothetical protein FJZ93_09340 [Chloroflexi bacterium]|nr:hypothetical protein [Chloroflexota bacterium]